jgi:hypothetical protein
MFAEIRQSPTKDSDWINPSLWRGLARCHGPVWTTLLGTPSEIAAAFLEYKQIGVSQFILSGWPELSEVRKFGKYHEAVGEAARRDTDHGSHGKTENAAARGAERGRNHGRVPCYAPFFRRTSS